MKVTDYVKSSLKYRREERSREKSEFDRFGSMTNEEAILIALEYQDEQIRGCNTWPDLRDSYFYAIKLIRKINEPVLDRFNQTIRKETK